jgi:hypothetical protein
MELHRIDFLSNNWYVYYKKLLNETIKDKDKYGLQIMKLIIIKNTHHLASIKVAY